MSCKKFVEIPPPQTQLVTASVFNNSASATAALTYIYTQMYSNNESYTISQANGLLADELTNYSTGAQLTQYYTNAMVATRSPGQWTRAYNYIYQSNAIIEALNNNEAISGSVTKQLTGEAKFLRAFWHFYLTNAYEDVPLVTTTAYNVNGTMARTAKPQVFQQIITDLKEAQSLLNNNYIDASDTVVTTERVRPTKWAATALLARAYLYTKNYDSAELQASAIINNKSLYDTVSLNDVFLTNSKETIWQLATPLPSNNYNTTDGYVYILQGAPSTSSGSTSTLSPQLLNSFETNDQRKVNWVSSITTGGKTYYFPYKYKVYKSPTISEYTMVLRLGEQYLIRAEARAQQGNLNEAISDLDIIRKRAGLPLIANTKPGINQSALLSTILHERQVELFTEWGHRWFDLIRTGNINSVMSVVTPLKGGTWNPDGHQALYPIPQSDRNSNPNLSQNVGY
jgi:starch-binding outer membrane protein, SusD/RagB family